MAEDLYSVLGVAKTAKPEDITKAYRKLAKKLHPDLNPGDKAAEEKFKKIAAAYGIIGDEEKRGRYDRGEIDASGQETPQQRYYREYAGGEEGARYRSTAGFEDIGAFSDLFGDLFGERGGMRGGAGGGRRFSMRGHDAQYRLDVDFLDAVNGTKTRITLPDGGTLDVTIPPGVTDGQVLRLKGKGSPGLGEGGAGDALIEIGVRPHPVFKRDGDDIIVEVPITFDEAVLGGKVEVPTISGRVFATVPPGSNTGQTLRLKGRGIKRGGQGRRSAGQAQRRHAGADRRGSQELRGEMAGEPPLRSARQTQGAGLMLSERDLLARVHRLTVTRLRVWVSQGWIKPADREAQGFSEADLARAALICNLEDELGFAEEDVPVLLNLIDQIHGLRAELKGLVDALDDLPPDVRATVRMRITTRRED